MNGDLAPAGGHRRKKPSKEQIAKMIRLGKKAQIIAKETTKLHEEVDVPKAEELLLEGLEEIEDPNIDSAQK